MKELKILYLYPDILELYGDFGNIQVLRYRLEQRGIKATIVPYSIGDASPDFNDFDLVFAGGGADQEQGILSTGSGHLGRNLLWATSYGTVKI